MRHRLTRLRLNKRIHTGAAGTSAAAPVLPTITGLIAWYDAEYGITLLGGGQVDHWEDKSGNGVTLSSDGINGPVILSNEFQGYDAVDFHNTRFLRSQAGRGASYAVANLGGSSVFCVMKVFSGGTGCVYDAGGPNKADIADYTVTSGRIFDQNLANYHEYDVPGVTYSSSTSGLTVSVGASASYYLSIWRRRLPTKAHNYAYNGSNNAQTYLFNPTDGGNAIMNLGQASDGAYFFKGAICEFLYYNSFIQTSNLSLMVAYFTAKYGVV